MRAFSYSNRRPGVWAVQPIAAGETIDESPVVALPTVQGRLVAQTSLNQLLEEWPNGRVALALGSVGLYRRSEGAEANAHTSARPHTMALAVVATKDIDQGAEIVVAPRTRSKALQARRLWSSPLVAGVWRLGRNVRRRSQTMEADRL